MKNKKKTFFNLLVILFIAAFFVTPLGHYGKLFLNRLFATSPTEIPVAEQQKITDYDWKLKDADWNFFNFEISKNRVVVINFWSSWRLPSEAELASMQKLYDEYKGKVDFYIITDELQAPVEEFMAKHEFSFPVTYQIIGEKSPFPIPTPPHSFVISKSGAIVVDEEGISDWNTTEVRALLDRLLSE